MLFDYFFGEIVSEHCSESSFHGLLLILIQQRIHLFPLLNPILSEGLSALGVQRSFLSVVDK